MLSLAHALAALITVAAVVPAAPNDSDGRAATPLAPVVEELRAALARDAAQEWAGANAGRTVGTAVGSGGPPPSEHRECTALLDHYGLCEPNLYRLPEPRGGAYPRRKPFVFLHLSKCAGTSLVSSLARFGYTHFSLGLPASLATTAACGSASAKCCWWRERLQNMSASGQRPKLLAQEPANEVQRALRNGIPGFEVDPGFELARDLCVDFAYATVLRRPVVRLHSHMCERGATFAIWQTPTSPDRTRHRLAVNKQLRDNYYVRAFGGADAWDAPEGALHADHLLAAARTLARFDVIMTVETLAQDSAAQMSRVGLPGFRWRHDYQRSRDDNRQRAHKDARMRVSDSPSCDVPPTAAELGHLVDAVALDAVLYDFARVLAARRTDTYRQP